MKITDHFLSRDHMLLCSNAKAIYQLKPGGGEPTSTVKCVNNGQAIADVILYRADDTPSHVNRLAAEQSNLALKTNYEQETLSC